MKHLNYAIALGGLWALTGAGSAVKAQVSLYEFEQSVQPYTEISAADGGYSLGTPTFWPPLYHMRAWVDPNNLDGSVTASYLNGAQGPGFPIGFEFSYNGDVFDRVGISNSGWISFGKSSDGNQAVWVYGIDHPHGRPFVQFYGGPDQPYKRNRVAGWGNGSLHMQDMSPYVPPGPITSLRIATIGTAPNRVCVIQWKDYLGAYPPSSSRINFQIRLNENGNAVDVQYGQIIANTLSQANVQVGLGGRIPEDFNSRQTVYEEPAFLYDWNTTVRGETNESGCMAVAAQVGQPNGSGIPPAVGLNFRWSPPACAAPAWPLTVSNIAFDGALVSWPANGAEAYDFFVSTENDVNGPEVASGTVNDAETYIEGLDAMTTYYVFVRSYCDGEPGSWGLGTGFRTHGGGYLACPGQPTEEEICSAQHSTYYWHYVSADGFSPVKIDFTGGVVGNNTLRLWHGSDDSGTPAFTVSGEVAGQTWTSVGGQLFIRLQTDAGACEAQEWFQTLRWRVGCKDCTDPLVNYSVVEDCENNEYSVEVDVFSMGTTSTLFLQNSQGVAQTEANGTGLHTAGPFTAGTSVTVSAVNGDNAMCYSVSPALINLPCALVDCGPTEYTLCYGDNDWNQWAFQGTGEQEIGIRFLDGTLGLGDALRTYNGADPETAPFESVTTGWAPLVNILRTSGAPSNDRTLVLELVADNSHSCQNEDPVFGIAPEIRYVVACYDGCVQPQATFTRTCLSQTQFEVAVNITVLGNTGSVVINNDGGAASVTATSIGTYTVGPFTAGTPVTLDVVGASVLCTWTSPAQNPDCSTIGIDEIAAGRMQLYPNPTEGAFRVELPTDMTGRTELQVLDLAGRVVAQEVLNTPTGTTLDLGHLPNGLYTVVAFGSGKRVSAKVGIQH